MTDTQREVNFFDLRVYFNLSETITLLYYFFSSKYIVLLFFFFLPSFKDELAKHSPAIRLRSSTFQGIETEDNVLVFPKFVLIHGESDNVVPKRSTKEFAR